jgi:hypothetical protein
MATTNPETSITITLTIGGIAGMNELADEVGRQVREVVLKAAHAAAASAVAEVTRSFSMPGVQPTETAPSRPLPSARAPRTAPVVKAAEVATPQPAAKKAAAGKRPSTKVPSDDEIIDAIREYQTTESKGPRKAELAKGLNVAAKIIKPGTDRLRAGGKIKTTGKKQGTRYLLTGK